MIKKERLEEILEEITKIKPILVIGDVGIDKYIYGQVTRISQEAPVPILDVISEDYKLGLASNVSNNLQQLKVPNKLFSVVGDDINKGWLIQKCLFILIDVSNIITDENSKTTFKTRILTDKQQLCRIDNEKREPKSYDVVTKLVKLVEREINECSLVVIQDYGKGVITEYLMREIRRISRDNNKLLLIDPNLNGDIDCYYDVDVIKPNLNEGIELCRKLGGNYINPLEIVEFISEKLNISNVVMTMGKDGMCIHNSKDTLLISTVSREVFDVSGAGDTVISLLSSCLGAGISLEESCIVANYGAGVVVGKKGTATVNKNELIQFFNRVKNEN